MSHVFRPGSAETWAGLKNYCSDRLPGSDPSTDRPAPQAEADGALCTGDCRVPDADRHTRDRGRVSACDRTKNSWCDTECRKLMRLAREAALSDMVLVNRPTREALPSG